MPRTTRWQALSLTAALALGAAGCNSGSGSGRKPAPPPPARLSVARTTPVNGATAVLPEAAIEAEFSSTVDFATVDATTFSVEGSASGNLGGSYSRKADKVAAFAPSQPYARGETVRVRLTNAIRSLAGANLEPAEFTFTVKEPDPPPPPPPPPTVAVTTADPGPYASDVPADSSVSLLFSEALDPSTIDPTTAYLAADESGRLESATELGDQDRRLTLRPAQAFAAGDLIRVHLGSALRAASGNLFPGATYRFRVATAPPRAERTRSRVFSAVGTVSNIASGRIDGDLIADVVYAVENEGTIDVLLGKGDGDFLPALRIDAGQPVTSIALADLDRDGDLDVLFGTIDRAGVFVNRAREESVPAGTARFTRGAESPTAATVRSLACGDLDRQGAPDVVLDTDRGLLVHTGGLGGAPVQTIGEERQSRTPVVLADLDLDGRLDLAFGDRHGQQVTVYLGGAAEGAIFGPATHTSIGADADQVAVENLTGDVLPEILVLTAGGASAGGAGFRLLHPVPGGYQVEAPGTAAAGAELEAGRFALGDLNGDGSVDVLLASAGLGKVLWFANQDGDFAFSDPGAVLFSAPEPWLVLAASLEGSGSLDVLAAGAREIYTVLPRRDDPPPPPVGTFRYAIDPTEVRQEDQGASALVRLDNTQPIRGYAAVIGYDPEALTPQSVDIAGTVTGTAAPEFTNFRLLESPAAVTYAAILDFEEPFAEQVIPAGENQLLFRLIFDVRATAPLGETALEFLEAAGDPPLRNEVTAGTESATPETTGGTVLILPPKDPPPTGNRMVLTSSEAAPGETGSAFILATTDKEVEAFTTIVTFDPAVLRITDFRIEGTATGDLNPDFTVPSLRADHAAFTVIFDFGPPRTPPLPPGEDLRICEVVFAVEETAPLGTYRLRFENDIGDPPLSNIFVHEGHSFYPALYPGDVRVRERASRPFIRGDFDGSGQVNIGDSISMVNHLFRSGPPPICPDAMDADDSGALNLTDSVFLLDFLFRAGPAPAAPYPAEGSDPTEDSLTCE